MLHLSLGDGPPSLPAGRASSRAHGRPEGGGSFCTGEGGSNRRGQSRVHARWARVRAASVACELRAMPRLYRLPTGEASAVGSGCRPASTLRSARGYASIPAPACGRHRCPGGSQVIILATRLRPGSGGVGRGRDLARQANVVLFSGSLWGRPISAQWRLTASRRGPGGR